MRQGRFAVLLVLAFASACRTQRANDSAAAERSTANGWSRFELRAAPPDRGLLLLLPGYNDDATRKEPPVRAE